MDINKMAHNKKHSEKTKLKLKLNYTPEKLEKYKIMNLGNKNPQYKKGKKQSSEHIEKRLRGILTWNRENMVGKTYEEIHGIEKSKQIKNQQKISMKKCYTIQPELKIMASKRMLGKNNPMFGKKHSNIALQKIKEKRILQITPIKDTSIEIKIKNFLNELQIEYFQHKYININHGYQCDFFIPSKNLVIECDGDYWHQYPTGVNIDKIRTSELIEKGFKVLRLWEKEIKILSLNDFKEKLRNF
jgi:very-short-patch-repair endonuclease